MPRPGKRVTGHLRTLSLLVVAAGAVASAGCLAVAAVGAAGGGVATYFYVRGKVCQEFVAGFADTWKATQDMLLAEPLTLVSNENDGKSGKITSRTADGSTITIDLVTVAGRTPAEASVTRVCVRIGAFGDQALSERFLSKIAARLIPGRLPPGPAFVGARGPIRPISATGAPETPAPPELPGQPVPVRKP